MEGICEVLFPHLDNANYGGDWEQTWKQERRICASERFGFYFQLGIPEGAISEVEANALEATFGDKTAFSEKIIELAKDKRLRPMLVKILDRVNKLDEAKMKVVISVLWDLEKEIADERSAMFDFDDTVTQVSRITYHSIKHLAQGERLVVLEDLVKNSKTAYPAVRFVSMLIDQQTKPSSTGEPPLVSAEDAEKLKVLSLAVVNKLVSENKLHQEEEMVFFLYRWKEWEGEGKVKEYIKKLITTREGLMTFLKGFVGKVLSTAGNYNRLDKKGIEPLYPLADIEALVKEITDEEITAMGEEDKEAINLFRNPPSRDW